MLKEGLLKENIDGEALKWACSRISKRREERKILMVISDGAPVDDSTLSEIPNQTLSKESVIEFIKTQEDYDKEESLPVARCRGSKEFNLEDQNYFQLAKLGYKWGAGLTHSDLKTRHDLERRLTQFAKSSNRITMVNRNGKDYFMFR